MIDTRTAPYAALVLRLAMGLLFIAHDAVKLFVFTPAGVVGFFGKLGLPAPLAYATMTGELVGGVLLLLGMQTRWVALAFVPLMLGTIATVHGANGWMFTAPGGGWEYPAFWTVALLGLALLGDGAYALKLPVRERTAHAIG